MLKKSQMWSLDSIIATVVFISALSAFIIIISTDFGTIKADDLKSEADLIPRMLVTVEENEVSLIESGKISHNKLKRIMGYEYDDLKSKLGVRSDFCIYFEDMEGNLINISHILSEGESVAVGNSRINVSDGIQCSK